MVSKNGERIGAHGTVVCDPEHGMRCMHKNGSWSEADNDSIST